MSQLPGPAGSDLQPRQAPFSKRLPDAVVFGFALWTLSCHAVVAAGGHLYHLLATTAFAGAFAFALAMGSARRTGSHRPAATAASASATPGPARGLRVAGFALGLAAVAAWAETRDVIVVWWSAVALLAAAGAVAIRRESAAALRPDPPSRGSELFLWSLAAACVAFTLVVHRFDIDDAFYANIAVAVADAPTRALYSADTLVGAAKLPLHNPIQRVLSLELLNGAVSRFTGLPALLCLHVLTAGFAALLVPLAQARLFRELLPERTAWMAAVAATLVVLLVAGDTHRSFGNYAFVRLWQGKAIFLTVALPLIYAYAIRFSSSAALGDWLRLAAAQVAAVGLTSTAIWAAPLAGGLALGSQLQLGGRGLGARGLGVVARGIAACLYPVGVGLAVRRSVSAAVTVAPAAYPPGGWLADSFAKVLGTQHFEVAAVAAVLLLFACARNDAQRRFAIFVPLGALLTVANPYLEETVRSWVTGPSHWRSVFAIPFPILLGLLFATPLAKDARGRALRATVVALLLLAFATLVPKSTPFATPGLRLGQRTRPWTETGRFPHYVSFGAPGVKVDPVAYRFASLLAQAASSGDVVVAPERVSLWLGTIHGAPRPLCDRYLYMKVRRRLLDEAEVERRNRLTRRAERPIIAPDPIRDFIEGLHSYDVRALLVRPIAGDEPLRQSLKQAGYRLRQKSPILDLWVRPPHREDGSPRSEPNPIATSPRVGRSARGGCAGDRGRRDRRAPA